MLKLEVLHVHVCIFLLWCRPYLLPPTPLPFFPKLLISLSSPSLQVVTEPSPATAAHPPLQATMWKQVVQMNLRAREQVRYESYLTDILVPESSSVTNVFHPAQASLDGSSYKPLSSPILGGVPAFWCCLRQGQDSAEDES